MKIIEDSVFYCNFRLQSERKKSSSSTRHNKMVTPRVKTSVSQIHMSRKHFVSEAAYEKYQKYLQLIRKKVKLLRDSNGRLAKTHKKVKKELQDSIKLNEKLREEMEIYEVKFPKIKQLKLHRDNYLYVELTENLFFEAEI